MQGCVWKARVQSKCDKGGKRLLEKQSKVVLMEVGVHWWLHRMISTTHPKLPVIRKVVIRKLACLSLLVKGE